MPKGRMKEVLAGEATFAIGQGDSALLMKFVPDASLDSIVTDPPAGIGFMGKEWDGDKGGRDAWIAWLSGIMSDGLRALKPGGWAVVWAIPRTSGWTQRALEDAGFEIRDVITHVFGSGFPKSHNVSKAIDKHLGAERTEVVGQRTGTGYNHQQVKNLEAGHRKFEDGLPFEKADTNEYGPATPEAEEWEGWGTALKPASEHWILARKPLEGTVAANVLAYGTGALNIDASRIRTADNLNGGRYSNGKKGDDGSAYGSGIDKRSKEEYSQPEGRWPANILLSHSPDCERRGTRAVKSGTAHRSNSGGKNFGSDVDKPSLPDLSYADADGLETVEDWACVEGCPVAAMDAQSGTLKSGGGNRRPNGSQGGIMEAGFQPMKADFPASTGGASRFFTVFEPEYDEPFLYCAKPSKREKNAGLPDGLTNNHPTVKSMSLMSWLIKLVTPPGGVVLDMFMGSGTTGCSAVRDGFRFIGLEGDEHNVEISTARITHWDAQGQEGQQLDTGN
jgi:DNA modification methylase